MFIIFWLRPVALVGFSTRVGASPIRRACVMKSNSGSPNKGLQRTCLPGRVCISHHGSVRGNQAAELGRWAS